MKMFVAQTIVFIKKCLNLADNFRRDLFSIFQKFNLYLAFGPSKRKTMVALLDSEDTYKASSYSILNHIVNHTCIKGKDKPKEK